MFQLENQTAKLSNLNLRAELHGEETKVDVDSFKFDCQDGGTVALSFRAIAHPSSDEIGRLSELVQREITLSPYPPSPEDQLKQELAGMDEEEE